MAKDRRKVQHIHSSVPDKQPTPASLEVGEIAVNNSKDQEFLSIKNSEDKVVRFSSDEQIVTIMEKKEVMPYAGYVRGETGPSATSAETPTADARGSYGITNNDLLNNKSNIIVKLNQVAAGNTVKHDKVNGAKDAYNKLVNPTTDSGLTDGAGFFIDMSRYAMQDANPQFSSTTNTCRTTMSGTTIIRGLDGDCGSLLDIKVDSAKTDIETANTEITSATTVIGTNGTTISGNTTLVVSGTTTETKNGDVTETNLANKVENTSGNSYNDVKLNYSGTTGGTTTIDRVGAVSVNNQSAYTLVTSGATIETKVLGVTEINLSDKRESTSGDYYSNINGNYTENISGSSVNTVYGSNVKTVEGNVVVNTSGTTRENRNDNVVENNYANYTGNTTLNHILNVSGNTEMNSTGTTCINSERTASLYGVIKTNIGINCSESNSAETINIYGGTIIEKTNSADTTISTATTVIGTANTSANTATLSGNTLSINESNSVSIETPDTTISGSNITINEDETVINSCDKFELNSNDISFKQCSGGEGQIEFEYCGGFSAKTNDFEVFECTSGSGQASIKETSTLISGNTLSIDELTSISAKTPTTYVSGTTLEVKETNVNVSASTTTYSGNSLSVVENSSVSVKTPSTTVSGSSMDINECTRISASTNNLEVKECANGLGSSKVYMTNTDVSGSNFNVVETTSINLKSPAIVESGATLTIDESTSISAKTPTTYVSGTTLEVKETNVNVSASTTTYSGNSLTETMTGNETYNIGGNLTEAVTGNTNITVSGSTTISTEDETTINTTNGNTNVNTTGNTCIHSTVDANFGGDSNTRIGANCNGVTTSDNTYIFAETAVTINTPTTNITGDTNISGNTVVSGNTNISGNTTIGGTTNISGATKIDNNLTVSGNTNISGNTTIGGTTYLSGDTYFKGKCTAITSNELGTAICEAFTRSVITIEEDHNPTDQSLAAVYTFYQNGETVKDASGNTVQIEVAKDKVLKGAVVTQNTSGEWVIRLTWITYDPDTQQSTETTTDVPASELVKDIDFVNTNSITGAVWYDSTTGNQKISADTTVVIKNNGGSGTKTFSKSNGTNTLTSYTLNTQSGAYSATSGTSFDPFNTGATINIPTDASHITRKTLKVTHNGFTDTYDPGSSDGVWTLPHSALTINYGTNVNGRSSSTTYNTSGATTIDIPTCVSGIGRTLLSINYGDVHNASNSTYDPGSSCSGTGATATIPTCLENLTNWTNSCLQIQNDVCVSGDVTANNFYSTSDIRKKHKVLDIDYDSEIKISKVPLKSYILNDDHTERKLYGVIAQDVEAVGLNELVHTDEKGFKSVDYTSLLILRISHLEKMIGNLTDKLIQLEDKLNDN